MASGGSGESRGLVMSAVALAVFAGVMIWALSGPPGEETADANPKPEEPDVPSLAAPPAVPDKPVAAAPTAPAKAPSAAAPDAPPQAEDLFSGTMPDFMADAHARTLDKTPLPLEAQRQLYDFGKQNPKDARPQLLLAWDSMNRSWDGIAVRMYRIAYRADPRAKDDPSMLRDLLYVAAEHDRQEFRETVEIVKEAYGEEALPRIDGELERLNARGDQTRAARLQRLRDAIVGK